MGDDNIDPFEGIDIENIVNKKQPKVNKADNKLLEKLLKKDLKEKKEMPEKDVSNDIDEKSQLINNIQMYGKNKRFSKKLRESKHNFSISFLNKKTIEELKLELERIDFTLSSSQNSDIVNHSVKYGLSFVETIVSKRTIFQIQGTSDKCFESEYFLDLLERAKMKYNLNLKMDPLLEMTIFITQTALSIHQSNKLLCNIPKFDLDEEIEEKPKNNV